MRSLLDTLLQRRRAWAVMLVFSMGPLVMYALIAWLPQLLIQNAGVSSATAGTMLSVFNAVGLVHSFLIPTFLPRMSRPFLAVVFAGGGTLIAGLVMLVVGVVLAVVFAGLGVILLGALMVAAVAVAQVVLVGVALAVLDRHVRLSRVVA